MEHVETRSCLKKGKESETKQQKTSARQHLIFVSPTFAHTAVCGPLCYDWWRSGDLKLIIHSHANGFEAPTVDGNIWTPPCTGTSNNTAPWGGAGLCYCNYYFPPTKFHLFSRHGTRKVFKLYALGAASNHFLRANIATYHERQRKRERQYPNDTIEARFGTIFWFVRCDGTKWRWHGKGAKARPTGLF